jgi:hypothetical protein
MLNFKTVFFYLLTILFISKSFAQINTNDVGSWAMLFNQTRLHDKWSIHSEVQFRSYEIRPNTEQLLLRAGINYHYNTNAIFTAGYGWITNYKDDGEILKNKTVNENRLWQQITLKNNIGRVFFEHRYRFEQRWIEQKNKTEYKNRIRYLLRISIPINKKEITKNTFFIGLYDEVFIHINTTPFDRNRLYGALGYQLSSSTNIQLGYLLQTVGTQSKQYLQFGINYNPDLRKKSS